MKTRLTNAQFFVTNSFEEFVAACDGSVQALETPYSIEFGLDTVAENYKHRIKVPLLEEHLNYLNSLEHGRSLKAAKVHSFTVLTWQWHAGNEILFYVKEISANQYLLYCYDSYWLDCMPVLEKIENGIYRISSLSIEHMQINRNHSCFIGGWGNPSHFFGQYFPRYTHALNLPGSETIEVFVSLRRPYWQRKLISKALPGLHARVKDIDVPNLINTEIGCDASATMLHMNHCWIFEDIPQWLGIEHTRSYFRHWHDQSDCKIIRKHPGIYLSRYRFERSKNTSRESIRVQDSDKIAKALHKHHNIITIFPENHDILDLQMQILGANLIISDPGSCNIHALVSPAFSVHNDSMLLQLDTDVHLTSTQWPSLRNFEWMHPILEKLIYCIGKTDSDLERYSKDTIKSSGYFNAVMNMVQKE